MKGKIVIQRLLGSNGVATILSFRREFVERATNNLLYRKWKNNSVYKNTHVGERCFILGNGPSLKSVNLSALADEYVISVNNFSQVKNYQQARTNIHLWMDLSFFQKRDDQKYDETLLMENYMNIAKEHPICFVPYSCSSFIEEKKLDTVLDIHYISFLGSITDDSKVRWDISKTITGFSTVVQYAVVIAMYMGFKEIYLLGCDSTNIVSMLNCAQNISNESMHAYDNDDVNERYKKLLDEWGMTRVFYDQYLLFLGYKRLYEECKNNGITLINCSSRTIINEIPVEGLDAVLGRGVR